MRRFTDLGANLDENDNLQIQRLPDKELTAKNNACIVLRQSDIVNNPPALILVNEGQGQTILADSGAQLTTGGFFREPAMRDSGKPYTLTAQTVLDLLRETEIGKHKVNGETHLMPLAVDFPKEFVDPDQMTVCAMDVAGLAVASVKVLHDVIDKMAKDLDDLKAEVARLRGSHDKKDTRSTQD